MTTNQLGDELTGDDALIVAAARILERGISTRSESDALTVLRRRLTLQRDVCVVCGVHLVPEPVRCEQHVHTEAGDPEWEELVSAWSSELPTEPGPYWHRFEPDVEPEPVQVVRTADGKLYRVGGFSRQLVTSARGEWQRIPEPRS